MRKYSQFFCGVLLSLILFSTTAFGAETPKYGGKLTVITSQGPQVIGFYPKMGPGDTSSVFPGLESLLNMGPQRKWEPELAESYNIDLEKNAISFKIRKGIKFHDGSSLTPDVVKWNYETNIANHKLQYIDQIKKIAVEGDRVVVYVEKFNPLMVFAYGWLALMSQEAYEKNGQDWCLTHFVGTGPFKQKEWKRDVYFKWEKNEDYWQPGKPYLDEVEYRYIPDTVTASSLMLANAGDIWLNAPSKEQKELQTMGLVRRSSWPGFPTILYLNTRNENAPTYKKAIREAIEYAIDKEAYAKATGYGFSKAIKMFHPEGEWAYDPNYKGREYNPAKAKELLKKAGYEKGLKLDLLIPQGDTTGAEAIKAFLGDIGVRVHLDIADPGRFYGSLFGSGWKDLCLLFAGTDANSLETFHSWFGHAPRANIASFKRPDELNQMSIESLSIFDEPGQKAIVQKMARYISDEALFVPIVFSPQAYMTQPGIHTNYLDTGFVRWQYADVWKE